MRANRASLRFGALLALAAAGSLALADPTLTLGSPAPAMKVAKWVKGKPVTKFEKGKVYVVEFWATWCGPCIESIPHLTDLAKKYKGKATFSGISVFEEQNPTDEKYFAKVEEFVKEMGPKMDYNVGIDGKSGAMGKGWMEAAGQGGIPTAFVVDKDSKIAWIGHPRGDLDRVVGEVVAGTFSAKKEQDRQAAQRAEMEKQMAKMKPLQEALGKNDHKAALVEIDKLMAENKAAELGLASLKFKSLLHVDEAAAYEYGRKMTEGPFKDDPQMLNEFAWAIVDDAGPAKKGDYKLAIQMAQRGVDIHKQDDPHLAYILDTLAYAHYKDGNLDKAMEYQQKAVAACETFGDKVPPATKQEIMDRMVMFRKKKAGGGTQD